MRANGERRTGRHTFPPPWQRFRSVDVMSLYRALVGSLYVARLSRVSQDSYHRPPTPTMADPTASSALHAPPTSYGEAAPPRKGILKNARSGSNTAQRPDDLVPPSEPEHPQPSGAAVPYRDSEGRYVGLSLMSAYACGGC